jgi:hypothetical protein
MIGWVEPDGTRTLAIGLRAVASRVHDTRALHRCPGESTPGASCRPHHDHRRQRHAERPDRARRRRAARRSCRAKD